MRHAIILYSNATGIYDDVLAAGITPHIRYCPTFHYQTKISSVSGRVNSNRLKIEPVISDDKLSISFSIKITECNFMDFGNFSVAVTFEDKKVQTLPMYVMCYDRDRPYGDRRLEYDIKGTSIIPRTNLNLASVNELIDTGVLINALDTEKSGINVYDQDLDGKNTVYITGQASAKGVYGLAVFGRSDYGGAGQPGYQPNAFPDGVGSDCTLITVYDGFFSKDDVTTAVPNNISNVRADIDDTTWQSAEVIYQDGNYGGFFEPSKAYGALVPTWSSKKENEIATNTKETYEVVATPSTSSTTGSGISWTWKSRYFIDENDAKWSTIRVTEGFAVSVHIKELIKKADPSDPESEDEYKDLRFWGYVATPPFVYGVEGRPEYYTVSASGSTTVYYRTFILSAANQFYPILAWINSAGDSLAVYKTEQIFIDVSKVAHTYQIFADAPKDECETLPVLYNRTSSTGSWKYTAAVAKKIAHTVMPYSPPIVNDLGLSLCEDRSSVHAYMPVRPQVTDFCLGCPSGFAGPIYLRYPYRRMWDSDTDLVAYIQLQRGPKSTNVRDTIYSERIIMNGGVAWDENWGSLNQTTDYRTSHGAVTNESRWRKHGSTDVSATVEFEIPLTGMIQDSIGVKSFCGMKKPTTVKLTAKPSKSEDTATKGHVEDVTHYRWEDVEPTYTKKEAIHYNDGTGDGIKRTWDVPSHVGMQELKSYPDSQSSINSPEITTGTVTEIEEKKVEPDDSANGFADCFFHISAHSDIGKVTQGVSAVAHVSASINQRKVTTEYSEGPNGEQHSEIVEDTAINTPVAMSWTRSDGKPREARVNIIGSMQDNNRFEYVGYDKKESGDRFCYLNISKRVPYTGYNYTNELKCEKVGTVRFRRSWRREGADEDTEVFDEVPAYALVGTITATRTVHHEQLISAMGSYSPSSCEMMNRNKYVYDSTYTITQVWSVEKDEGKWSGDGIIDRYRQVVEVTKKTTTTSKIIFGTTTKYTKNSNNGDFTKTVTESLVKDGNNSQNYITLTTESESNWVDGVEQYFHQNQTSSPPSYAETREYETFDKVTKTIDGTESSIYDTYRDWEKENYDEDSFDKFELPEDDYAIIYQFAEHTEDPLWPMSGQAYADVINYDENIPHYPIGEISIKKNDSA